MLSKQASRAITGAIKKRSDSLHRRVQGGRRATYLKRPAVTYGIQERPGFDFIKRTKSRFKTSELRELKQDYITVSNSKFKEKLIPNSKWDQLQWISMCIDNIPSEEYYYYNTSRNEKRGKEEIFNDFFFKTRFDCNMIYGKVIKKYDDQPCIHIKRELRDHYPGCIFLDEIFDNDVIMTGIALMEACLGTSMFGHDGIAHIVDCTMDISMQSGDDRDFENGENYRDFPERNTYLYHSQTNVNVGEVVELLKTWKKAENECLARFAKLLKSPKLLNLIETTISKKTDIGRWMKTIVYLIIRGFNSYQVMLHEPDKMEVPAFSSYILMWAKDDIISIIDDWETSSSDGGSPQNLSVSEFVFTDKVITPVIPDLDELMVLYHLLFNFTINHFHKDAKQKYNVSSRVDALHLHEWKRLLRGAVDSSLNVNRG